MTPQRLRVHLLLIVTLSGAVAFLSSVMALALGVSSMALRYPLAVVCGYAAFLALIRGWVAWHRRTSAESRSSTRRSVREREVLDIDLVDTGLSFDGPTRVSGSPNVSLFAGGKSGGGGGGVSWGGPPKASSNVTFDVDVDDVWPIVLAVVCVLGGALAIAYIIYSAPVMLAEVAVDAAIASGLYRRLKKREPSHWAVTVLRHTWMPAVAVVIFAALGGYAAHAIAPDARSIGGVIRALRE